MKKICILGSNGYIGSHLSDTLKYKYSTIVHSRKKISDSNFYKNIHKVITGDIKSRKTLKKIINSKPDVIIYTISYNHFKSEENLSESLKNNYEPFQNLINLIIKQNLNSKIIYFSTMQVYGRKYSKKIIDENHQKNILNIYSLTHSMCEDLLQAYEKNIKYHVLRLSNSFGFPKIKNLDCWWPVLNDICRSAKKNRKIVINSDGSALRDFIYLEEISDFLKILINKEVKDKVINICSSNTISIRELALKVQKNSFFKKEKIKVIFKKKQSKIKNKSFFYSNKIMIKNGFKKRIKLDDQIKSFLEQI